MTEESVERLLEFEIRVRKEEEAKGGWSDWVLLGAMAGLGWTGVTLEVEAPVDWGLVCLQAILALSLIELLSSLVQVLAVHRDRRSSESRYFQSDAIFGAGAPLLLLIGAYGTLVVGLLLAGGHASLLSEWSWTVLLVSSGIDVVASLAGLLMAAVSIPIGKQRFVPPEVLLVSGFVARAVPGIAALSNLQLWWLGSAGDRLEALLVVAISLLAWKLVSRKVGDPALVELHRIRQDLALGRDSLPGCVRRIDIAIKGMRLSDVLSSEIAEFSDLQSQARSETERLSGLLVQAKALAARGKRTAESDGEISSFLKTATQKATEIHSLAKLAVEAGKSVAKKLNDATRYFPATRGERNELANLMEAELESTLRGSRTALAEFDSLDSLLQAEHKRLLAAEETLRGLLGDARRGAGGEGGGSDKPGGEMK